ncbi:MAG: signal peptide peptidase SppA [Syntrophobacteraceae bacterium]|nr:signal peptide peptidase SppA [Desulfobacteraceae bacterium]
MKRFFIWFAGIIGTVAIGLLAWWSVPWLESLSASGRIGVVEIRGTIDSSQETLKAITQFRKDSGIKAIILRIDSPGGGIGPSQEIYREVRRTISEKPVVASLGGVAASGGYYIASASSRIVSNPGTITGSIGVITYFPNLRELFGKIGYDMVTLKAGKFKDVGNPGREMTPEEKALMQATLDDAHSQFIGDIAAARRLPEEKVREIADGRIILGQTARQLGLVDDLGNFEDAVRAAASLGRMEGEPELTFARKKKTSLLDLLLGSETSERISALLDGSANVLRFQMPTTP